MDPVAAKLERSSLTARLMSKYYRSRLYEDHALYLGRISQAIEIVDRPFVEQTDALEQFQAETVKTRKAAESEFRLVMFVFLMPDVKKVGISAMRDRAHISCMTAAIATERFRLKFDRWPVELDDLCPQYLAQVPIDPFDGTPLKSSKNEDGFVIYSVGADRVDNGGEQVWARDDRSREPSDVGIQLFNPDRRRLPPEPKKGSDPDNY